MDCPMHKPCLLFQRYYFFFWPTVLCAFYKRCIFHGSGFLHQVDRDQRRKLVLRTVFRIRCAPPVISAFSQFWFSVTSFLLFHFDFGFKKFCNIMPKLLVWKQFREFWSFSRRLFFKGRKPFSTFFRLSIQLCVWWTDRLSSTEMWNLFLF